jgi:hypothetical protein
MNQRSGEQLTFGGLLMGIDCNLFAFPESEARRLLDNPGSVEDFIEAQLKASGWGTPEWWEGQDASWAKGIPHSDHLLSLQRCWHGLHFTLTGTAWDGTDPLRFLVAGGLVLGTTDYGDHLLYLPEYVRKLDRALADFTDLEFQQRFDLNRLANEDIYPGWWDEPAGDFLPMYLRAFQDLKWIVHQAARRNHALFVYLW